jgi:hypothetical protein
MALRLSCLIHAVLLLCLGCSAHHRPVIVTALVVDDENSEAKDFVAGVAAKMPLWDADGLAKYEQAEIATVKADIAMAQREEEKSAFLETVTRLHHDWDALLALDQMLKKESLI